LRSFAYFTEASRQARMRPVAPAATVKRPFSRANIATRKPSPSAPTRFSTGTSTSCMEKPPVLPARIPHFSLIVYELNPLNARSTMKAESPEWSRFFFFS
jgi:hypothetical protein